MIFGQGTVTWKGTQRTLRSSRLEYDPDRGSRWVVEFEGSESAMRGLAQNYRTYYPYAYNSTERVRGPIWRTVMQFPFWPLGDAINAEIQEEWSTNTEIVENDLFSLEDVAVTALSKTGGLSMAKFRQRMEDGIEAGKDFAEIVVDPSGAGTNPEAEKAYTMLARGQTGYETEYQTVTRLRRATIKYPWARTIYSVRKIYSTDELGIPGDLGFSFENRTTSKSDMKWGWRLRDQSFNRYSDRQEEQVTWALAEWSTFVYDESDGAFS